MFNKANAPYIASSTLAIAALLASGVFAVAPYVGLLAPVAALNAGLPFIIGGAVSSVVVIALSFVVMSKNKTVSEKEESILVVASVLGSIAINGYRVISDKEAQISSLKGQLAKKEKVIEAKNKVIINLSKDGQLKRQHRKEKQEEILDCADLRNLFKDAKWSKRNISICASTIVFSKMDDKVPLWHYQPKVVSLCIYTLAVVLKVNRKILKINFYLVDYKAKDAFNTFYVI